jgi:dTDP-glucose 4,6-dehydratase
LARAWHKTYQLPVVISNCSNNYGPYQFPEKLVPLIIHKALAEEPLPIYGKGDNVRDWLYVVDHVKALWMIVNEGAPGEVYNVGGHNELQNIKVVKILCSLLDARRPRADGSKYEELMTFVKDRAGHDQRYAIDATKMGDELNWLPDETFDTGLAATVDWYLENQAWCKAVSSEYQGERLGTKG